MNIYLYFIYLSLSVCESYVLKKDEIVKLKVYRDAWWFHKTEEKLTRV